MGKYIDTLEWDKATNEVQKKARIIQDLQTRLLWLDSEITKAGGKTELNPDEELDFELFNELPEAESLYIERLQNEKLRTKDLLYLETLRSKALAMPDKTGRLFFLIEEQAKYVYDKEQHATDLGGWKDAFPDWIVPMEGKEEPGMDESMAKALLDNFHKELPYIINEMESIHQGLLGENYFFANDLAAMIGEMITEMQAFSDELPTQGDNDTIKFKIAEVAILHVYLSKFGGKPVTLQNCNEIALQYGFDKPTSSKKIYHEYLKYKQDSERLNINTSNKVAATYHIKRFEKIIPILENENPQAAQAAKTDLGNLKRLYEKHY